MELVLCMLFTLMFFGVLWFLVSWYGSRNWSCPLNSAGNERWKEFYKAEKHWKEKWYRWGWK